MHKVDFIWTSDKEYSSLLPLYDYMKKNESSVEVNMLKVKKFSFQNYELKKKISDIVIISHDRPLKRLKKNSWQGKYIYIEHGLSPMKYWTYKYKFFHESSLLFYPGEVFKRKMEAINPNFKNGLLGGYPKVDELVNQKRDKQNFCKKHDLNINEPIILFAPSYGSKKINDTGISNAKYLANIKNLIIIPHPADYPYAKKYGALIPNEKANINSYIINSDIVISDVSSIIAEAAIVDKPTIQLILPIYPGCFPYKDKRKSEEYFLNEKEIQIELDHTNIEKKPYKIPYIDEEWIFGYTSTPQNIEQVIDMALANKNKYISERRFWSEQSCYKADGKICKRLSQMITNFIKTGKREQVL